VVWWSLREEYTAGQWRLVGLERQVGRLRKVIAAQRGDEQFIREQAQAEFDIPAPGEQRIPVEPGLTLKIGQAARETPSRPSQRPAPAIVSTIATSRTLADALLAVSAALALFAFSVLYERQPSATTGTTGARGADGVARPVAFCKHA
jgi:hypothetical protein